MEKLEIRKLNSICKDKNIEELYSYLDLSKSKIDKLYSLRNDLLDLYLKKENHLDYLSWVLYQLDMCIKDKEYKLVVENREKEEYNITKKKRKK